jgi:WD40 repeat protein
MKNRIIFGILLFVSIVSAVENPNIYTVKIQNPLHNPLFSHDNRYLYLRNGAFVEMWDVKNVKIVRKFPIDTKEWWENVSIDIDKNNLMIAEQKTIKIWDISSSKKLQTFNEPNNENKIFAAAFDIYGNILYSVETPEDYKIKLWNIQHTPVLDKFETQFLANTIEVCSPDILLIYNETRIAMYNYETNKLLWKKKFNPLNEYISDVICTDDMKSVYIVLVG